MHPSGSFWDKVDIFLVDMWNLASETDEPAVAINKCIPLYHFDRSHVSHMPLRLFKKYIKDDLKNHSDLQELPDEVGTNEISEQQTDVDDYVENTSVEQYIGL